MEAQVSKLRWGQQPALEDKEGSWQATACTVLIALLATLVCCGRWVVLKGPGLSAYKIIDGPGMTGEQRGPLKLSSCSDEQFILFILPLTLPTSDLPFWLEQVSTWAKRTLRHALDRTNMKGCLCSD